LFQDDSIVGCMKFMDIEGKQCLVTAGNYNHISLVDLNKVE